MLKNLLMLCAMAGVFAAGTACFTAPAVAPPADPASSACAGLEGEAKRKCEQQRAQ